MLWLLLSLHLASNGNLVLADFEKETGMKNWRVARGKGELRRIRKGASQGRWALLLPKGVEQCEFIPPQRDWSAFAFLRLSAYHEEPREVWLRIGIGDEKGLRYVNFGYRAGWVLLPPRRRILISWPIKDLKADVIGRPINYRSISKVVLTKLPADASLVVDAFELVPLAGHLRQRMKGAEEWLEQFRRWLKPSLPRGALRSWLEDTIRRGEKELERVREACSRGGEDLRKADEALSRLFRFLSERTVFIWGVEKWLPVRPSDLPSLPLRPPLAIRMCVNERESVAFNLTNLLSLPLRVRLRIGSLLSVEGKELPPSQVNLFQVEYVTVRHCEAVGDGRPSKLGDALVPLPESGIVTLLPRTTHQFWLTVDGGGIEPGVYNGSLEVWISGGEKFAPPLRRYLPLCIVVEPVRLPDEAPFDAFLFERPLPSVEYLRDLEKLFVNHFLLGVNLLLPRRWDELRGEFVFDWTGLERFLKLEGRRKFIISYSLMLDFDRFVARRQGWKFMSEEWKERFLEWVEAFVRKLAEHGIGFDQFAAELWDEAPPRAVAQVAEMARLIKRYLPRFRIVQVGNFDVDSIRKLAPFVDLWVHHLSYLDEERLRAMRSKGAKVWGYTCHVMMRYLSPTGYYRLNPWLAWRWGLDGIALWTYNAWAMDPWDSLDNAPSGPDDEGLVYPGLKGPLHSKRWEAWREGMEDCIRFRMLEEALRRPALSPDLRAKISSLLSHARKVVERWEKLRSIYAGEARKVAEVEEVRELALDLLKEVGSRLGPEWWMGGRR